MKKYFKYFIGCILMVMLLITCNISDYKIFGINYQNGEILIINGKTIMKDSNLDTIKSYFGEPKIESKNAYGGNSYTFYDDTLMWYLHVEMDSNGVIKGIGCISDNFESTRCKAGDTDDYTYTPMGGIGITGYSTDIYVGTYIPVNLTYSDRQDYFSRMEANEAHYTYELQAPTVAAARVLAVRRGKTLEQEPLPLELYDYIEKLHDNGVNVYDFAKAASKDSSIKMMGAGSTEFYACLPNPVELSEMTQGYSADTSTFKYLLFELCSFKYDTYYRTYGAWQGRFFIDPSFINQRKIVELTDEEKEKMANVTEAYKKYSDLAKETSKLEAWDEEPVYMSYPLTAGVLKPIHLQLSTYFLNTIRAGIGLNDYELDMDMAESAQHKATLVTYLNNYYDGEDKQSSYSHVFPKPSGIDQDFYDIAMRYSGENLFMGNHITGIMYAINDHSDVPYCGHRYALLSPYYTKWGIGWVGDGTSFGSQSCHKFDGVGTSDLEIVAWPANGVTVLDAFVNTTPYWTCQKYNGPYNFSSVDKVIVKNLSAEQEYEITNHVHTSGFIAFSGSAITYEDGDVFEVTLKNVTNTSTGESIDYSYRSVFHKCYGASNVDGETLTTPESVSVTINKEIKLPVSLESESNNKLLTFTSSNEDIVTVRQNGVITGISEGTATITVKSALGSENVIEVNVSTTAKGDVNQDDYINATDASIILDKYKNNNATSKDYDIGDMNEDNLLNSTDAAMILDIFKNS